MKEEIKNGYYLVSIINSSHYNIFRYSDGKWYTDDTTYHEVNLSDKSKIYPLSEIKNIDRYKKQINQLEKRISDLQQDIKDNYSPYFVRKYINDNLDVIDSLEFEQFLSFLLFQEKYYDGVCVEGSIYERIEKESIGMKELDKIKLIYDEYRKNK